MKRLSIIIIVALLLCNCEPKQPDCKCGWVKAKYIYYLGSYEPTYKLKVVNECTYNEALFEVDSVTAWKTNKEDYICFDKAW